MGSMKKIDQVINEWKAKGGDSAKCAEELEDALGLKKRELNTLVDNFYNDLISCLRISKDLNHLTNIYKAYLASKHVQPVEFSDLLFDKWEQYEEGICETLRDRVRTGC